MFKINEDTPIAALTVGQFKSIIAEVINGIDLKKIENIYPEIIGKKQVAELTGYALNTINKMVCEKRIPYYKPGGGKVTFKRDEIRAWMTKTSLKQ
jgi:excisionase family DNA binding protein